MPQLNRLLSSCTSATLLLFSAGLPHSFAQTLPDYLPTDGLVAWYPLDGTGSNFASELEGAFSDLAFAGGGWSENRYNEPNSAFNPASGRAYTTALDWNFGWNSVFTTSIWFTRTPGAYGNGRLISTECNAGNYRMANWSDAGGIAVQMGSYIVVPLNETSDWVHLVHVMDHGVERVYIDGVLQGVYQEEAYENQTYCSPFTVGAKATPAFDPWPGLIDDIGIWNRALTDAEVMALYLGEPPVAGCTDATACNFNPEANADDGSCVAPGCGDPAASNYDSGAPCSNAEVCAYLPEYLPSDGLVGWWPFNGNANDESGNGNHGTELNGVEHTSDRFGSSNSAFDFDGVDDRVFVNHEFFDNGWEEWTFSAWCRIEVPFHANNVRGTHTVLNSQPHTGLAVDIGWGWSPHYSIWIGDGQPSTYWNVLGNAQSNQPVILNHWKLITLRREVGGYSLFINGVQDKFWSAPPLQHHLYRIYFGGCDPIGSDEALLGKLDDIGIWNRALTDAEVMALYLGEPPMWGCVDPTACNYNPEANADDGSCVPSGCTDAAACNYDIDAGCDDGSCAPADAVVGCMEPGACNFNAAAVCAGTCVYPAAGLADCAAGGALCGEGMVWDVAAQTCTIDPEYIAELEASAAAEAADAAVAEALDGVCGPGTVWDINLGMCTSAGPTATCASDLNGNGAVEIQDLLILLSDYETLCPVPEPVVGACGDLSAVSFDGYSYPLVAIGSQCWFKENLRTAHYRNGDPIPGNLTGSEWSSTGSGAQTVYGEGTSTVHHGSSNEVSNLATYGRLYNWYAVNEARGLCPTGWHVPSDGEWTELETVLGGASVAGAALKSSSSDMPPWDGTNMSGFTGVSAGYRASLGGHFVGIGTGGHWWSATGVNQSAWNFDVQTGVNLLRRDPDDNGRSGESVRCLKD